MLASKKIQVARQPERRAFDCGTRARAGPDTKRLKIKVAPASVAAKIESRISVAGRWQRRGAAPAVVFAFEFSEPHIHECELALMPSAELTLGLGNNRSGSAALNEKQLSED